MRVMALDLGTRTGWACSAPNEIEVSGTIRLDRSGDDLLEPEVRDARRFDRWSMLLCDLLMEHKPAVVLVEAPAPGAQKGRAAPVLLGLRAITLNVLERREKLYREVPPTEWQKWARSVGWAKGNDENDALHMCSWFIETQLGRVLEAA